MGIVGKVVAAKAAVSKVVSKVTGKSSTPTNTQTSVQTTQVANILSGKTPNISQAPNISLAGGGTGTSTPSGNVVIQAGSVVNPNAPTIIKTTGGGGGGTPYSTMSSAYNPTPAGTLVAYGSSETAVTTAQGAIGTGMAGVSTRAQAVMPMGMQAQAVMPMEMQAQQLQQLQALERLRREQRQGIVLEEFDVGAEGRQTRKGIRFLEDGKLIAEAKGLDTDEAIFSYFGGSGEKRQFRTDDFQTEVSEKGLFFSEPERVRIREEDIGAAPNPFFTRPMTAQEITKVKLERAKEKRKAELDKPFDLLSAGISSVIAPSPLKKEERRLFLIRQGFGNIPETQGVLDARPMSLVLSEESLAKSGKAGLESLQRREDSKFALDSEKIRDIEQKSYDKDVNDYASKLEKQYNKGIISGKQYNDLLEKYSEERGKEFQVNYEKKIAPLITAITARFEQYEKIAERQALITGIGTGAVLGLGLGAIAGLSTTAGIIGGTARAVTGGVTLLGIPATVKKVEYATKKVKEGDVVSLGLLGLNFAAGVLGARAGSRFTTITEVPKSFIPGRVRTVGFLRPTIAEGGAKPGAQGKVIIDVAQGTRQYQSPMRAFFGKRPELRLIGEEQRYVIGVIAQPRGKQSSVTQTTDYIVMGARNRVGGRKQEQRLFSSFVRGDKKLEGGKLTAAERKLLNEYIRLNQGKGDLKVFPQAFLERTQSSQSLTRKLTAAEGKTGRIDPLTGRQMSSKISRGEAVTVIRKEGSFVIKVTKQTPQGEVTSTRQAPEGSAIMEFAGRSGRAVVRKKDALGFPEKSSVVQFVESFFGKTREYQLASGSSPRGRARTGTIYFFNEPIVASKSPKTFKVTSLESKPTDTRVPLNLRQETKQRIAEQRGAREYQEAITAIADSVVSGMIPQQRAPKVTTQTSSFPIRVGVTAGSVSSKQSIVTAQSVQQPTTSVFSYVTQDRLRGDQITTLGFVGRKSSEQRQRDRQDFRRNVPFTGTGEGLLVSETEINKQDVSLGFGQAQNFRQVQQQRQLQRPLQRSATSFSPFGIGSPYPKPLKPVEPKTPKFPPTEEEEPKKKVRGFLPEVKIGRVFKRITSKAVTRERALQLASQYTDVTPSKQFRVVPTQLKVKAEKRVPKYNLDKFRTFARRRGEKVPLGTSQYIERSRFALERGEQRIVQPLATRVKRQRALARRGGLGFY